MQEHMDRAEREVLKLSEALLLCQRELAQVRAVQEELLERCSHSQVQSAAATALSEQLADSLARLSAGVFWEIHQPATPISLRRFLASRWPRLARRFQGLRPNGLSELQQIRMVEASQLFEPAWYLRQYPDVALAGISPAVHYVRSGAKEGRDPGPAFSTEAYLASHPELRESGTNPLVHMLQSSPAHGG